MPVLDIDGYRVAVVGICRIGHEDCHRLAAWRHGAQRGSDRVEVE